MGKKKINANLRRERFKRLFFSLYHTDFCVGVCRGKIAEDIRIDIISEETFEAVETSIQVRQKGK